MGSSNPSCTPLPNRQWKTRNPQDHKHRLRSQNIDRTLPLRQKLLTVLEHEAAGVSAGMLDKPALPGDNLTGTGAAIAKGY